MSLVLALDAGGSAVKATVARLDDGAVVAGCAVATVTSRPDSRTAELDPAVWWAAACRAISQVREQVGQDVDAVVCSSLRQGFVLVDSAAADATEVGPGVLNGDRRGADQLATLVHRVGRELLYSTTGHWPAPELTLPKLMHLAEHTPERLGGDVRMLFVHDWLVWRLSGVQVTEGSLASGGQLMDVAARTWADDLLAEVGLPSRLLPELRSAGSRAGRVRAGAHGLRPGTPVLVGGADTMVAALGAGGAVPGAVTVVAGSSTPIQAALPSVPRDPLRRPWVSTHLAAGTWAAESNCGYPGGMLDWFAGVLGRSTAETAELAWSVAPGAGGVSAGTATTVWDEAHWAERAPAVLTGFSAATSTAELARAYLEAHAFGIRAGVTDLERAVGCRFDRVVLTGGATVDARFAQLVADVLGRGVQDAGPATAAAAAAALARGETTSSALPNTRVVAAQGAGAYDEAYARFRGTGEPGRVTGEPGRVTGEPGRVTGEPGRVSDGRTEA